ncbi:uncharacterized protein LOC131943467 isoform X3 [Physella acuta]|uniref:uncharacterized protein LOC131943467 isoform X3 n=1 Tax=Physella acuta TaxID=109671 RepID=UPI0027DE98C9|nr:uncharacterized protein LOC131943467 isoform X3 [Physella acuta]
MELRQVTMPLPHSPTLEGFGCGGASGFVSHKRKLESCADLAPLADYKGQGKVTLCKRKCIWPPLASQCVQTPEAEDMLPGCLKDIPSSPSSSPMSLPAPLPRNMASNNLAQHFLSRIQQRLEPETNNNTPTGRLEQCEDMEEDTMDLDNCDSNGFTSCYENNNDLDPASLSMDSDFVPDASQYARISSPQNITHTEADQRCTHTEADQSGLKPSPVSGRLHCHCSASWRGMYGIDNGYITDYY